MKTTVAILAEIRLHKTCSVTQLYRYFAAFNITPVGVRQRPRLYPDHAAQTILIKLGLAADSAGCGIPGCPNAAPPDLARRKRKKPVLQIDSMDQLRAVRAKSARRAA